MLVMAGVFWDTKKGGAINSINGAVRRHLGMVPVE